MALRPARPSREPKEESPRPRASKKGLLSSGLAMFGIIFVYVYDSQVLIASSSRPVSAGKHVETELEDIFSLASWAFTNGDSGLDFQSHGLLLGRNMKKHEESRWRLKENLSTLGILLEI